MFNLPVGVKNELDDQDMMCEHCDRKDDVDNGEYVNHRWYCEDCYEELSKVCPKCNKVIISIDDELCEDCTVETYDGSAQGMFEKLGYSQRLRPNEIVYAETFETNMCNQVRFNIDPSVKTYDAYLNYSSSIEISIELHKAIHQQLVELKWL